MTAGGCPGIRGDMRHQRNGDAYVHAYVLILGDVVADVVVVTVVLVVVVAIVAIVAIVVVQVALVVAVVFDQRDLLKTDFA